MIGWESTGARRPGGPPAGIHADAPWTWDPAGEIDGRTRAGTTTARPRGIHGQIAELEHEARELRRANKIVKSASAYFAREPGPREYPHRATVQAWQRTGC